MEIVTSKPVEKIRTRNWTFTLNNYSVDEVKRLVHINCLHLVFQSEISESGTPHLQGMIGFKNARRFGGIKRLIPRAHIEKCRNIWGSIEYCQKRETHDGKIRYAKIKGIERVNEINLSGLPEYRIVKAKGYKNELTEEQKNKLMDHFQQWVIKEMNLESVDMYLELLKANGLASESDTGIE